MRERIAATIRRRSMSPGFIGVVSYGACWKNQHGDEF